MQKMNKDQKNIFDILKNAIDQHCYSIVRQIICMYPEMLQYKINNVFTPLLYAVYNKCDIDIIKFILDKRDNNFCYGDKSVLHCAALSGRIDVFELLISYGADPYIFENYKMHEQNFTIASCEHKVLCNTCDKTNEKTIILKANIHIKKPILFSAICSNNYEMVKKIIDLGVDLNNTIECKHTNGIDMAFNYNKFDDNTHVTTFIDPKIVKLLVDSGINITKQNITTYFDKVELYYNSYFNEGGKHESLDNLRSLIGILINEKTKNFINYNRINDPITYLIISQILNNNDKFTIAHVMAFNGNYDVLDKDIFNNIGIEHLSYDINYNKYHKHTPILFAIIGKHYKLAIEMINKFNIEITYEHIVHAILSNDIPLLKIILDKSKNDPIALKRLTSNFRNIHVDTVKLLNEYPGYLSVTIINSLMTYENFDMLEYLLDKYSKLFSLNYVLSSLNISNLFYTHNYNIKKLIQLFINYGFDFNLNDFVKKELFYTCTSKNRLDVFIHLVNNYKLHYKISDFQHFLEEIEKMMTDTIEHFNIAISMCPADDLKIKTANVIKKYLPELKLILANDESYACSICFDYVVNFTNASCGHKVLCNTCASKMKKCPQCLTNIVLY